MGSASAGRPRRLGHGDPVLRWPRRCGLDRAPILQHGVRPHQSAGHPGRRRAQPKRDRQLAREDQRRGPAPVLLRADLRLRRPDRPDGVGERHRRHEDAAQPDRLQEADARRQARLRGRHGARRLAPTPPIREGRPCARRRRRRACLRRGSDPTADTQRADPAEVTRTLASLADLRDRGAITPEEYEAKKTDLLSRL